MAVDIFHVKAFTQDPEKGNPALVLHVDDLRDEASYMTIVREARCSVAIVLKKVTENRYQMRIFYEHGEQPVLSCGHATLAAAHTVLSGEEGEISFEDANVNGIKVEKDDDMIRLISKNRLQTLPFAFSSQELADTLGISQDAILGNLPVQLAGLPGKEKLIVPVSYQTLLSLQMDPDAVHEFCNRYEEVTGILPFAFDPDGNPHIRHFPPRKKEDDVCGVGGQGLAHYLRAYGDSRPCFTIHSGPGKGGVGMMMVVVRDTFVILGGQAVEYSPEKGTKRLAKSS